MTLYIDINNPAAVPVPKPQKAPILNDPAASPTNCSHWTDAELAEISGYLVVTGYDPRLHIATGGATDNEDGTATPNKTDRDLATVKDQIKAQIDAAAEAARLQFITAGAGQALTYSRKETQARDCLANYDDQSPPSEGTYPALDAEVDITADSILGVAAIVVANADAWAPAGDAIETIRLGGKKGVVDAADLAAAYAVYDAITWPAPS